MKEGGGEREKHNREETSQAEGAGDKQTVWFRQSPPALVADWLSPGYTVAGYWRLGTGYWILANAYWILRSEQ